MRCPQRCAMGPCVPDVPPAPFGVPMRTQISALRIRPELAERDGPGSPAQRLGSATCWRPAGGHGGGSADGCAAFGGCAALF